jgi:hypothetical protein
MYLEHFKVFQTFCFFYIFFSDDRNTTANSDSTKQDQNLCNVSVLTDATCIEISLVKTSAFGTEIAVNGNFVYVNKIQQHLLKHQNQ